MGEAALALVFPKEKYYFPQSLLYSSLSQLFHSWDSTSHTTNLKEERFVWLMVSRD